jgi:hypothetical protein
LLKNGVFRTVDFPRSTGTDVVIINDSGLMLGDYYDANGNEHGFLAIECPELPGHRVPRFGVS